LSAEGGGEAAAARAAAADRDAPSSGFLASIERFGNRLPDPVLIFVWLMLVVVVLSIVGAAAGWQVVNPVSREVLTVENLLSSRIIERFLVEMPKTLTGFAPLGYVLLVMLGAGLAERSGLFSAAMRAAVRGASPRMLTPLVLFVGIMGNQAADAAYVVLIPLAGALYAAAGRHPIVGIAVAFAGVAGGFSANLLPGQLDALLLGITEPAARLLVPDWTMNVAGNWYFIGAMTFLFVPVGWYVTEKYVEPRLGRWTPPTDGGASAAEQGAELTGAERRGLRAAGWTALGVVVLFAGLTIPQLWSASSHGAPLFDEAAAAAGRGEQMLQPLLHSMVAAFFLLFLLTGIAYGRASGATKSHRDEIRMISDGMASMSYYIVLAFVAAHFIALFNWSNLGAITAINGAELLARAGLPAPVLMAAIVVLAATINLAIGSASAKWAMLAPVLVPMLMLLGISPEMTTAAFRMGDSVTNPITPLMVYFPLVLTFCQRWASDFGMGGLMAAMMPYTIGFAVSGLLMTVLWMALGVPPGPGASVEYALPGIAPR
jgi:aminobenzoyl-glutamate transport protein